MAAQPTNNQSVNNQSVGIKNSWSLMAFTKIHGNPKMGQFVNSESGEMFNSLAFMEQDNPSKVACLVGFSSRLGELSASEIKERKDELQVVELESGNYKLCQASENTWADIDLL